MQHFLQGRPLADGGGAFRWGPKSANGNGKSESESATQMDEPEEPPAEETRSEGEVICAERPAKFEVVSVDDRVVRLCITCTCGKYMEIECVYPEEG